MKRKHSPWPSVLMATAFVSFCFAASAYIADVPAAVARLTAPAAPWSISTLRLEDSEGHGSGVYLGKGYILTAAHVVADHDTMQIRSERGGIGSATVLWANKDYDVALLRTDPLHRVRTARLDCSVPLNVGDAIEAVGNPYSLEFVHTYGRVAGERRKMETAHSVFLANMVILPGMSGGPVFKEHRLVGLVNAVMQAPIGMGFGSPVAVGLIIPLSSVCAMLGPAA